MNREELLVHCPEVWKGRILECHASLPSTNDRALELVAALGPAAHLAAVFAEEQTAGRGRQGRFWHTVPELSVACTVVVTKGVTPRSAGLLPLAAALAVGDALRRVADIETRLRWPNDVDAAGGKVAGVLVEGRWRGSEPEGFAVGAGVNLLQRPEDFPEELRGLATSVFAETGKSTDRPLFAGALLKSMEERIGALRSDPASAVHDAAPLWAHIPGKPLAVATAAGVLRGDFAGVGPSGELLLDLGGERLSLIQGEVLRVQS
jgi:BirA family transcriptional regulator, biotin operon repressor / biotin---[acetyl-CoA-carboxylase] ligase